jgi:hypothetical protein
MKGEREMRAAIFIGPEFGTVQRADLVAAARAAGDAGFDVLIACAFNYEAHATKFSQRGRIPVLKARMNADLHMAENLKIPPKATSSSSATAPMASPAGSLTPTTTKKASSSATPTSSARMIRTMRLRRR